MNLFSRVVDQKIVSPESIKSAKRILKLVYSLYKEIISSNCLTRNIFARNKAVKPKSVRKSVSPQIDKGNEIVSRDDIVLLTSCSWYEKKRRRKFVADL